MRRTLVTLALGINLIIAGCKEEKINKSYFAEIPMNRWSGMAITSNDFDNDGHQDLVVGAYKPSNTKAEAKLYFFKNDGKGSFTLQKSN